MKSLLLVVALVAAAVAAAHAQNLSPAQVVVVPGTVPLPKAPAHFVKAVIVDEAELAKYAPAPRPSEVAVQPIQVASAAPAAAAVQPTAEGHFPLNMTAVAEKEAWNQDQAEQERVKKLVEQALAPEDNSTAAAAEPALPTDPAPETEFDYTPDGLPEEPTESEQFDFTTDGLPEAVDPTQEVDFAPDGEAAPAEAAAAAPAAEPAAPVAAVKLPETVYDNVPPPGVVAESSEPAAPLVDAAAAVPPPENASDNTPPPGLFSEGEGDAAASVQPETSFDQAAIAAAEQVAEQAGAVPAKSFTEMAAEVGAACGSGGTCRARNTCSTSTNTIRTGLCPGAASIICCQPITRSSAPAPAPAASGSGVQRFLAAARSKIGRPYARGAAGPNAFDCSGLVNWAARQAGLTTLPRTADQLSKFGRAVNSVAARQPGDLIFFGKPGQKVYHVGIYVGPNQMIDAPHTGAFVRQENYSYWPDKLTVARRIF